MSETMNRTATTHPLDPLDAAEIGRAVALARTAPGLSDRLRVIFVEAREPEKAAYLAWRDGGPAIPRAAIVTLNDCGHGRGLIVDVDLDGDRLIAALQAGLAAGGEEGPVRSCGMVMVRDVDWYVADLRVDWSEGDPIAELAQVWDVYRPQLDDYVTRALDPTAAPSYGVPGDE